MTRYARPADVAVVVGEGDGEAGVVYLAALPDGPVQVLNGVGSLIWLEATDPSSDASPDLVDRVADLVDRRPEEVRSDVLAFLTILVENGLLERRD